MPRLEPDDAKEWINRARSSLLHARAVAAGVYLEELCFDAQQAAEKAVKAVFVHRRLTVPYIHDLETRLSMLADADQAIPDPVWEAKNLSAYAVEFRYPAVGKEVTDEQYAVAIRIASNVLEWASEIVGWPGA